MHCAGQQNDGMTITDQIPYPGKFTGFTGDNGTATCASASCDKTCGNCGMCGCYHCCGGFSTYSAFLDPATRPMMFMQYYAPTWPIENYAPWFVQFKAHLDRISPDQYVGVQMALWTSGMDDKINSGEYDAQIDALVAGFKSVGRPVWLRIGYEFNGPWNKHEPAGFIKSWTRITKKLRADPWTNKWVATVWDYTADAPSPKGEMDYAWQYYPGDEWVDWAGVNLFSGVASPSSSWVAAFIKRAEERNLPIMFGESTPRQAAGSWGWYADYFAAIRSSPNVRAACYINWDWFPSNWGNTRIESSGVGAHYQAALAKEEYNFFHATDRDATLKRLGLQ